MAEECTWPVHPSRARSLEVSLMPAAGTVPMLWHLWEMHCARAHLAFRAGTSALLLPTGILPRVPCFHLLIDPAEDLAQ